MMSRKLVLKTDDELWNNVKKFKIDNNLRSNNEAVIKLIQKGLNDSYKIELAKECYGKLQNLKREMSENANLSESELIEKIIDFFINSLSG